MNPDEWQMAETLSPYFQEIALNLIHTRNVNTLDGEAVARWIGRASAVLAEALRVAGNDEGIDAIIGVPGGQQ